MTVRLEGNRKGRRASQAAQWVKTLLATPEMPDIWVQFLGWEDLLEEGTATHSSILAEKNHMNRGALGAKVHGVPKSRDTTEVTSCITH